MLEFTQAISRVATALLRRSLVCCRSRCSNIRGFGGALTVSLAVVECKEQGRPNVVQIASHQELIFLVLVAFLSPFASRKAPQAQRGTCLEGLLIIETFTAIKNCNWLKKHYKPCWAAAREIWCSLWLQQRPLPSAAFHVSFPAFHHLHGHPEPPADAWLRRAAPGSDPSIGWLESPSCIRCRWLLAVAERWKAGSSL